MRVSGRGLDQIPPYLVQAGRLNAVALASLQATSATYLSRARWRGILPPPACVSVHRPASAGPANAWASDLRVNRFFENWCLLVRAKMPYIVRSAGEGPRLRAGCLAKERRKQAALLSRYTLDFSVPPSWLRSTSPKWPPT
jgi:hypothetical protein